MGSEETPEPCLKQIANKRGVVLYEDICKTKTVYASMAGGTGIGGPKFRIVTITGPDKLVDDIVNAYARSLGEAS